MQRASEWIASVAQDLRHSARMLRRRPTYTSLVMTTLALGIGMNTAIFSVLYGVVLQPLPFDDAERLVRVGRAWPGSLMGLNPISASEFRDLQGRVELFEQLVAVGSTGKILRHADRGERVLGSLVTPALFGMLRVRPQTGRFFTEADAFPDAEATIVISDGFWKNRLGADPDAVGSTVEFGETTYTVIGIAPPDFSFRPGSGLSGGEYWEPLRWTPDVLQSRHNHWLRIYGRLAPGAGIAAASDELFNVWREVIADDPGNHLDVDYEVGMRAIPLQEFSVSSSREPLMFLSGAVALILLIASANVASLMLANAESRQQELAVRAAIGAGRARLARQFLTESLLLAGSGGVLGVFTAALAVWAVLALFPGAVPRSAEVGLHLPVLAFAATVSLVTAVALGLATVRHGGIDAPARQAGARGQTARMARLRQGLIVAEVSLVLMLAVSAGLMIKSYWHARSIDLGFARENLLAVNLTLPAERYPDRESSVRFYEYLVEALGAHPQVDSVGMTDMTPIRDYGNNLSGVEVVGRPGSRASYVEVRHVSRTYHDVLRVPLIRGRGFSRFEAESEAAVAIINETLARELFGDEDPIGHRLALERERQIVGVVADMRASGPDRDVRPYMYFPARAAADVLVRLRADVAGFVPELRSVVRRVDSAARVWRIETMEEIVGRSLGDRRFQITLIGAFAAVALALGAVGTYGVIAYTIEGQMREFGIRVAVGAAARDIRSLVLRGAGGMATVGLMLGLIGSYALRHYVSALLFQVQPWDPAIYGGAALTIGAVALLACWIPARRAAGVDPITILRRE